MQGTLVPLHEGHLGEVTKGWGSDLINPPPLQNLAAMGKNKMMGLKMEKKWKNQR